MKTMLVGYYSKMIETPFENESTISFNIEQKSQTQDNQIINQLNIILKGKVDAKNKNIEESINLNYSPQVTFPINIRYKDGLFGYQTEYVGSKYIVDDRTSSSTLSVNENEDENSNEESLSEEEEITDLFIKYGKIAIDQIGEDKFSKEQNGGNTIYKIALTPTDIANILKGILEELKQDQETIEKFDLDTKDIDDGLEEIEEYLNENKDKEENIEILLYKNSSNINKVELKYKELIGSLEKITQDGKIQYNAIISGEDFSAETSRCVRRTGGIEELATGGS